MAFRAAVITFPGSNCDRDMATALEGMGFQGVEDVRVGRLIELDVADDTSDAALNEMCRRLLANLVIENYRIEKPETAAREAA